MVRVQNFLYEQHGINPVYVLHLKFKLNNMKLLTIVTYLRA